MCQLTVGIPLDEKILHGGGLVIGGLTIGATSLHFVLIFF
jgi:hypothetical protein